MGAEQSGVKSATIRRPWRRLTYLQEFTILTALVTFALVVAFSIFTSRVIETFVIRDDATLAAELALRAVADRLRPEDFRGSLPPARRALLDAVFRARGVSGKTLRVRLWAKDRLIYSNITETRLGSVRPCPGQPAARPRSGVSNQPAQPAGTECAVQIPVRLGNNGRELGTFEILYDLSVLNDRLARIRGLVWKAVPMGFLVLYMSIYVIVRRASRQLLRQQQALIDAHLGTFHALARAIDAKDAYTGDHSTRVADFASLLAKGVGLRGRVIEEIRRAARLHDIGKIAVPDAILRKTGPLNDKEDKIIRQHTEMGYAILRDAPLPERVKLAVLHSHERWDGTGYPHGLAGEAIPLPARILSIADSFEAMVNDRPYRPALSLEESLKRLKSGAGTQFDPRLIRIFSRLILNQARTDSLRIGLVNLRKRPSQTSSPTQKSRTRSAAHLR